jgi:hypothetical protein
VNPNEVFVNGYTRENGTTVAPHYRTAPNSTNIDNFSTLPNINPHTLEPGYILPDSKLNNTDSQIYLPDYTNYNPNQNELPVDYSYENERILEKIRLLEYNYNSQKSSYEVIDLQNKYYDQNTVKNIDYDTPILDSSAVIIDSSLVINTPSYQSPKVIILDNTYTNKKNDFTNKNIKNENDSSFFAKIFAIIFIILILKKIIS